MEKKLLIICYVYPPDKGVGGRRWSKFAKQLAKDGNKVFVITATPDEKGNFSTQDIDGVRVKRLKSPYPKILRYMKKMNLWHKIKYRLAWRYYENTRKGNIYDPSIDWDRNPGSGYKGADRKGTDKKYCCYSSALQTHVLCLKTKNTIS